MGYWKEVQYHNNSVIPLKKIRKFHNYVKMCIFRKCITPGCTVMDLCGGRGVDLYKYHELKARYVYYVDSDKEALQHALTIYQVLYSRAFQMNVSLGDLNVEETMMEIRRRNMVDRFDVLVAHMCLHYFLKSESIFKNWMSYIQRFLKPGGYLVISGLDGQQLHTQFQTYGIDMEISDVKGDYIAKLKALYDTKDALSNTGQKISVEIASIGCTHEEFLFNFNFVLQQLIDTLGLKVISDELYTEFHCPYSNGPEYRFSKFHRTCLLRL